jgi:hypothetical protein
VGRCRDRRIGQGNRFSREIGFGFIQAGLVSGTTESFDACSSCREESLHNTKGGNVAVVNWYEFAAGNPVLLHRRPESAEHAAAVVARAEANIGKPYLFAQNCEHFASFAFTGEAESKTLQGVGWIAAGVLAVAVLTADAR